MIHRNRWLARGRGGSYQTDGTLWFRVYPQPVVFWINQMDMYGVLIQEERNTWVG